MASESLDVQLYHAIRAENVTKVETLLKDGANPNGYFTTSGGKHTTLLELASYHVANWPITRALLLHSASVELENNDTFGIYGRGIVQDRHPFCKAILMGDLIVIKHMLKFIPDFDAYCKMCKLNVYELLTSCKIIDILFVLLDAGANVNQKDRYGNTLLHHAVRTLNIHKIHALLSRGADPNIRDGYGHTIISEIHSSQDGPTPFLMLVAAGARLDFYDIQGRSLVDHYISKGMFKCLRILHCLSDISPSNIPLRYRKDMKDVQKDLPLSLQAMCSVRIHLQEVEKELGIAKKSKFKKQRTE